MLQCLASLLLAAAFAAVATASLTLETFDAHRHPDALCNDGSRSGVYFKPAIPGAGQEKLWLLWLQGGGWCFDEKSCEARYDGGKSALMTSKVWHSSVDLTGIFSPDPAHSPLASANKAYLAYCTSDGHMGNRGASDATFGWHFRGQKTVEAALQTLQDHGMGAGHTLVFGGSSAGGRGAMVTCDFLPSLLPAGVKALCVPDSPYWIDIDPMKQGQDVSLAYTTQHVYTLANASGRAPQFCKSHFPGNEWKCLFGQFRMPLLKDPYLMYASQSDAYQIGYDIGHRPQTQEETKYAEQFGNITRTGVQAIVANMSSLSGVYSSNCYNHAVSESTTFYEEHVQGSTMAQALAAFLLRNNVSVPHLGCTATNAPLQWIDTCTAFACGPGCV